MSPCAYCTRHQTVVQQKTCHSQDNWALIQVLGVIIIISNNTKKTERQAMVSQLKKFS